MRRFILLLITILSSSMLYADPIYTPITWSDLIPNGWSIETELNNLQVSNYADDDAEALKLIEKIADKWAKAPINSKFIDHQIEIEGFVAPLEWKNNDLISEFLLVPFFGSCIHAPAPPANQIIYIKDHDHKLTNLHTMDYVRVTGTLLQEKNEFSSMASSSYSLMLNSINLIELPDEVEYDN